MINRPRDEHDPALPVPASDAAPAPPNLTQLFHEHNASLVQLLRARLRSDQEARDVAQEAYVRLLQLDRLGTISYLRTYLFRTALNLATDRLRSAAVRTVMHRDPVFDPGVDELSPDRVALAEENLGAVTRALDALPAKTRHAFLLHRFAGLETHEVAQRLGVTDRMVRHHLVKALLCCRRALHGEAPVGDEAGGVS
jgi:RNA polymerase sigma factor (sigma-70 family)